MQITKYNASGNDFIIYHDKESRDRSALAKLLCDRQKGVGADGMVVLIPHVKYDFEWDFYNCDGSQAAMCGNATRAVAHYAVEQGISLNNRAEFLTRAGLICAEVNGVYIVTDMPKPKILRRDINAYGCTWWLIDSGVPHLLCQKDNVEEFDLAQAKELREEYDANVNIYSVGDNGMKVRTYERGVEDETLACGTGIMACYVRALEENSVSENSTSIMARSGEELYMELDENDTYRFGGKVTKTFVAETESIQP
ncbi:MAG: diaminopimelate epimerase [Sulfurovum sp.]|nr:diaminopimelate epimerase [Sulfurovum sp.]